MIRERYYRVLILLLVLALVTACATVRPFGDAHRVGADYAGVQHTGVVVGVSVALP